jgi:mercuric ion transport protein
MAMEEAAMALTISELACQAGVGVTTIRYYEWRGIVPRPKIREIDQKMRELEQRKTLLAGAGGVAAAVLGSLCCAGPIVFVTLGVGAGLASTFEPLRPLFGVVMLGLFAIGFRTAYGQRQPATAMNTAGGQACEVPRGRKREKIILWSAAAVAAVLWTFPIWSIWLI